MTEQFYPIPGNEDTFISRSGIVISRYGKVLKHMDCTTGYYRVKIRKKRKNIHRLLAETFIPNPNNYPMVNHIDGDKKNNSLDNLEWCTSDQNMKHAQRIGLLIKGTQVHTNILDEAQVLTIKKCLTDGMMHKDIAGYFKVHPTTIGKIASGKNWKHLL